MDRPVRPETAGKNAAEIAQATATYEAQCRDYDAFVNHAMNTPSSKLDDAQKKALSASVADFLRSR